MRYAIAVLSIVGLIWLHWPVIEKHCAVAMDKDDTLVCTLIWGI